MIHRPDFAEELRIKPYLVMALMPVSGALLAAFALNLPGADERILNLPPLLWGLSAAVWALHTWRPTLGRWFLCIVLAALVLLSVFYLDADVSLPMLAIPAILAVGLLGVRGAILFAVGETVALAGLLRALPQAYEPSAFLATCSLIWAIVLIAAWLQRPVLHLAEWSWSEFVRSRAQLEEARDRQVELKRANEDLAHANRQLTLLNEKVAILRRAAEESEHAKAIFVANVSHELRTPLNVIIGLSEVMTESPDIYDGPIPEAFMDDLDVVHRNCEHLASIVDDVLDLSRLEAERLTLHRVRTDLVSITRTALSAVRPLLERKGLWLRTDLPQSCVVDCDPVRIRQVILNLVSNAARFTVEGGVILAISEKGATAQVSVTDTGLGIDPKALGHLFEPFYRAAEQTTPHAMGTGLGLCISERFVDLHGGKMWVDSQVGVGSTFSFDLPQAVLPAPTSPPTRWQVESWIERSAPQGIEMAKLENRIVVCDRVQSRELCQLFGRYTPKVEYVPAATLQDAREALDQSPAEVILINAQHPDHVAARMEQAKLYWPDTPLVGTTLPSALAHQLEATHAVAYLVKPIRQKELRAAIQQAVGAIPRTILIVDDDADVRHVLELTLTTLYNNAEIIAASCGREALEQLQHVRPDVMLLDLVMPGIDGWEMLRIKQEEASLRDIPTIVVSAQDLRDTPPRTAGLQITTNGGLGVSQLLRCMRRVAAIMRAPETEPLE